ncbi:MAG: hypothetical protein K9N46_05505 [Candidatus Marinimicrobia bacterium]|nr:hypothetical protein [Candidatus Neomarinimicrobiota bacterium]MCF7880179.1 hypothetical protein [Candidatus Neomarinimicrobiota bacterium]
MKKLIDELMKIVGEVHDTEGWNQTSQEEKRKRGNELIRQIKERLVFNPGTLIHYEDSIRLELAKTVVESIWEGEEATKIFDEMISGDTDALIYIMGPYTDRIVKLKPTFISVDPASTEFKVYFEEAMQCWLFG